MKFILPLFSLLIGLFVGSFFPMREEPRREVLQVGSESLQGSESRVVPGLRHILSSEAKERVTDVSSFDVRSTQFGESKLDGEWFQSLSSLSELDRKTALLRNLDGLGASDFPGVIHAYREGPRDDTINRLLCARWAEVDPEGLLGHLEAHGLKRWGELSEVLYNTWAKADADAAVQSLSRLPPHMKRRAIALIAENMIEASPRRALQMMGEHLGPLHAAQGNYRSFFMKWALRDRDAAYAAAESIENPFLRSVALIGAMDEEIRQDPRWALDWLGQPKFSEGMKRDARKKAINYLLAEDSAAALSYISSRESHSDKMDLLAKLNLNHLAREGGAQTIEELIDWVDTITTGQLRDKKVQGLLEVMAQVDPYRAQDYVVQMEFGPVRMKAITQVVDSLTATDLRAAQAFANSLEYDDERSRAVEAIGRKLQKLDPKLAREYVLGSGDLNLQDRLARGLAQDWAVYDRQAALDWVEQLDSANARRGAMDGILRDWVVDDPEKAFSFISSMGADTDNVSYYRNALGSYFRVDPVESVAWLQKLSDEGQLGEDHASFYRDAVRSYMRVDPMAASEWVATLEDGANRDSAVIALVDNVRSSDPEAGFAWATTISDPDQRKRYLEGSINVWARLDAQAAYEAINDASIDVEEKEALFKLAESR